MEIFADSLVDFFQHVGSTFSTLWNINSALVVSVLFGLIVAFLLAPGGILDSTASRSKSRTPTVDARIGYKRAWLEGDSFKGVVGIPYSVDEEADGPGFHAYSTFRDARYHPQAGNVYLEVLLSGFIHEHTLGYTASHQRVLQVIAGDCVDCDRPATHYFLDPKPTVEPAPVFLCQRHSRRPSGVRARLSVQKLANRLRGDSFDQPIKRLAEDFDWLGKAGVVTAPYSGEEAFLPTTVLPKK